MNAIDYECSTCGAPPGEHCIRLRGAVCVIHRAVPCRSRRELARGVLELEFPAGELWLEHMGRER